MFEAEDVRHERRVMKGKDFMRNFIWRCWVALVACGAAMTTVADVRADDTFPPCWRGLPDTTYQLWNFATAANPAAADAGSSNPYGAPQAAITLGTAAGGWINTQPVIFGNTRSGIWELGSSGSIAFSIPNEPTAPATSWKYVHVQVTQYRDGLYSQLATVAIPGATLVRSQLRTNEFLYATNGFPFNGRWVVHHTVWLIEPCPASEVVTISSSPTRSLAIDSVVIDTKCATSDPGDISVPCWRGAPGSTYQNWSFHRPGSPSAPELENNPGSPQATLNLGGLALGWQDELVGFGCRQGYWDLGNAGKMTLAIPNTAGSPTSHKNIQVQVVEFQDSLAYIQLANVAIAGATLLSQQQTVVETTLTGNWVVHRTAWRLAPSPASENVVITAPPGSALIDQVVVDTLSLNLALSCPSDQTLPADAGQCERAGVSYPGLPVADGCILANVTCVPPNGSTFQVGTAPVACTITDTLGATTTCNFNITIKDLQVPTVTCPTDMLVTTKVTPSLCGALVNFTPTAMDNCPGVTVACVPPSGGTFPLGVTAVTCTAKDASLNLSTPCTFNVTVTDLSGDVNVACWRGQSGSTYQHWAFGDNSPVSAPVLMNSPGSPTATVVLGPLTLNWQNGLVGFGCKQGYWDLGNGGTITLAVPNVAGPATAYKYLRLQVTEFRDSLAYNVSPTKTIAGATLVSDQETPIEVTLTGDWVVHETIWKFATCPASETIVITAPPTSALVDQVVVDTFCVLPPVCPLNISGNADSGTCVKAGITWALPAVDGCVVKSVTCKTNGVTVTQPASFPIGVTTVICSIVDAESQVNTCTFSVTIADAQAPLIVSCAPAQTIPATLACQAILPDLTGLVNAIDCAAITVTQSPAAGAVLSLGAHSVLLTATDAAGNSSDCTAIVTVTDITAPSITSCGPNQTATANGTCEAVVPDFTAGVVATDCNGPLVITQSPTAGTLVGLGTTIVTVTVADAAGNVSNCGVNFVVTDTTAPSITSCGPNQSATANGTCQAVVPDFTAGVAATDCNGPLVITQSPTAGTLVGLGTTVVTVTVADAAGNVSNCGVNFVVTPQVDIEVSVATSTSPVTVGTPVTYNVTVTNLGGCTAADVVLNNLLSAGQVLVSMTNLTTGTMNACPTPGAVAWWSAEGNAQDRVGSNHGTASGGTTYSVGQVAQAFHFDGVNGNVSVPDAPALRPASLTIEGWIKIQDPNGLHVIVAKPRGVGTEESFSLWIESGSLHAAVSDAGGAGPSLTHPDFPTSSLFVFADIVNLPSLAAKLKVPVDPVSTFVNGMLSAPTLNLLALYAGGPDVPLQRAIVSDLNQIIQGGAIYTVPRFAGVTLAPETTYLLGRNPMGTDLVRLNRLLLRDAYSAEIGSVLFPELNQWHHVAYTFDNTTKVQVLYVNGKLVDVGTANKTITYDNSPLLIGAGNDNGSAGYFYQGRIDELALYARPLSGLEVEAIYTAGNVGKCDSAGPFSLGSIPAGGSVSVCLVAVPVQCPTVSLTATVTSSTADPSAVNNMAVGTITVDDISPAALQLSIRRVSINNNFVRITWPLTCAPYILEGTGDLNSPILWSPSLAPIQIINGSYSTVIHADDPHKFFRLRSP